MISLCFPGLSPKNLLHRTRLESRVLVSQHVVPSRDPGTENRVQSCDPRWAAAASRMLHLVTQAHSNGCVCLHPPEPQRDPPPIQTQQLRREMFDTKNVSFQITHQPQAPSTRHRESRLYVCSHNGLSVHTLFSWIQQESDMQQFHLNSIDG